MPLTTVGNSPLTYGWTPPLSGNTRYSITTTGATNDNHYYSSETDPSVWDYGRIYFDASRYMRSRGSRLIREFKSGLEEDLSGISKLPRSA